ncbi:hypothetical protein ANN_14236 [Periplaneta americana]|uniref:Uncharacterized protein n=1 Tax=Periplaneta americana TaxID=6978 RepID=A0ABQ8SVS9_PERAM|nr:hypothetical protein ANN_14236 [Periplaneta americana]
MAGLCEGGNEPPGSLKAKTVTVSISSTYFGDRIEIEVLKKKQDNYKIVKESLVMPKKNMVKDRVYTTRVNDVMALKRRIRYAVNSVTENMLNSTRREIDYRFDILRATRDAHVQVH